MRYAVFIVFSVLLGAIVSNYLDLIAARDQVAQLSQRANKLVLANESLAAELIEQQAQAKQAQTALISRANDLTAINEILQSKFTRLKTLEGLPDVKAFNNIPLPYCLVRLLDNKASANLQSRSCAAIDTSRTNGPNTKP